MADRLSQFILEYLQSRGPATAIQICNALNEVGVERSTVNKVLYRMIETHKVVRDTSVPPVWSASVIPTAKQDDIIKDTKIIAVVDLGNVHDSLKELVPYAQAGLIRVEAFADRAFNGFGIKPSVDDVPNMTVHRARTTDRNAADIELVWRLCELLPDATGNPDMTMSVVVATKDQGFQALKELVQRRGHALTFVTQWTEMRELIE